MYNLFFTRRSRHRQTRDPSPPPQPSIHREPRTKRLHDRPALPPSPPPVPDRSLSPHPAYEIESEGDDSPSEQYDESAREFESAYFPIRSRRMFQFFLKMRTRSYVSTKTIDFDFLERIDLRTAFLSLTRRAGFHDEFWSIPVSYPAYAHPTMEFLSSLRLRTDTQGTFYIRFRLCREVHRVRVTELSQWFHFDPPATDSIGFGDFCDRQTFWYHLTGQRDPVQRDFRANMIPHPLLRILHRILVSTIYARGETVLRCSTEDLALIATILSPRVDEQRPDLMLLMIHHWLGLQRNSKDGGFVTCGSYITYIGHRLGLSFSEYEPCERAGIIDAKGLQSALFLRIQPGVAGFSARYIWRFGGERGERSLPFECPISFEDTRTWRLEAPLPSPPPEPEPQPSHVASPSCPADVHMEDAPFPPQVHHPSSSSSSFSFPDMYALMLQLRETQQSIAQQQTEMRTDFDRRLTDIELELAYIRAAVEGRPRGDDGAGPSS